ncbi:hypothetical protein K458DRAFT_450815 [Lentithecium fluviatile CBS 122367]|uniref:Uncharacterized protein n=1 Tax=Lentithecium fluviatile CBS 122367 TaxID=1168545 RepID=A0A6G1J3V8_9PLEO|nr:hypothetical protein K458DRAFT_450815 [Lentithecium fluviatile CBS 122367]
MQPLRRPQPAHATPLGPFAVPNTHHPSKSLQIHDQHHHHHYQYHTSSQPTPIYVACLEITIVPQTPPYTARCFSQFLLRHPSLTDIESWYRYLCSLHQPTWDWPGVILKNHSSPTQPSNSGRFVSVGGQERPQSTYAETASTFTEYFSPPTAIGLQIRQF